MRIYRKQLYVSDEGIHLFEHELVSGESESAPLPRFSGQGQISFTMPTGASVSQQFNFAVPGESVEEAFANFVEAAKHGQERAQSDFRLQIENQQREASRRLVLANSIPSGNPRTRLAR